MTINRVVLAGNLTREPERRESGSGAVVLSFGIAVNERFKNKTTDEWEERPNYFDCVMFGKRADAISKYLSKGDKVAIEGKLRWSQYTDKQGNNRSSVDVVVDEVELMSKSEQKRVSTAVSEPMPMPEPVLYSDDIPF